MVYMELEHGPQLKRATPFPNQKVVFASRSTTGSLAVVGPGARKASSLDDVTWSQ